MICGGEICCCDRYVGAGVVICGDGFFFKGTAANRVLHGLVRGRLQRVIETGTVVRFGTVIFMFVRFGTVVMPVRHCCSGPLCGPALLLCLFGTVVRAIFSPLQARGFGGSAPNRKPEPETVAGFSLPALAPRPWCPTWSKL